MGPDFADMGKTKAAPDYVTDMFFKAFNLLK